MPLKIEEVKEPERSTNESNICPYCGGKLKNWTKDAAARRIPGTVVVQFDDPDEK